MNRRKYVWIGIAVLVSLCLLVSSASATQTTLEEGDVALGVSATKEAYTIYNQTYETQNLGLRIDSGLKLLEYQEYYVYKGIINNKTGVTYEEIPSVVIQPINLKLGAVIYGTGTLKIWKKGIADAAQKLVYVDYEFDINMNQTWQNSISSDQSLTIYSTDDGYYNNLFVYYGALGGAHPQKPSFKFGLDMLNGYLAFANENGVSIFVGGANKLLGSNAPYEQTDITYQTNFYNEYDIYADDAGFRGINITRVCSECTDKFTKSKVYALDKEGDLLLESLFEQDVNSSYYFPAEPLAIWLVGANMESDGTDKYILIYDDTEQASYCCVKGYTSDAEAGTILTSVDVTLGGYSDTSDGDGFYFIGPVVADKDYTLTGSKSGYYDRIYDLYLPYAQDYLIDLPLIPEPPTHTGHGILGIVTTLQYYGICENHTVNIENATWSDTTTTNSVGYYIFDNLEVDDYWINVSKTGYRDNNQTVTVSATGDEVVTIDNCDSLSNVTQTTETTLYSSADSYIAQSYSTTNYGSDGSMLAGYRGSDMNTMRTLVNFSLSIPSGATINEATLSLNYYQAGGTPSGASVTAHNINQTWEEGTITWDTLTSFNATTSNTTTVPGSYTWMEWDVTSNLQQMINGDIGKNGWLLKFADETGNKYINLYSKEHNGNDPKLFINYTTTGTEWNSDNTLTLNTTDKHEGTGSLQSLCSNTLDFNKSAPSAVDASAVTKSNGYLAFWYKVNDTTRLSDYIIVTVGSDGNNATNKISWSVHKSNFVNDTWREVFLKFSDGTESGTLNMSNVNWFELKAPKSNCVITKIDDIRFYDFSYEIHDVDLDPILALGVIVKTLDNHVVQTFTAVLGSTTLNTTSGEELIFVDLHYGMHELTVTSEGYFPSQRSIYLDKDMNVTVYMTEEQEGGVGTQYAPPHLVRFFVQDIYGNPKQNVEVTTTCVQTTMGTWSWLYDIFGYKNETQIQNTTMNGTTDSAGGISFLMVETIKYNLHFENTTQNINENLTIYPKSERYTVIVGRTGFFDVEPQLFGDEIDWNFTMERINTTAAWLNFTYNDTLSQTTSGSYYVYMVNETTGLEKINTSNVTYFCSTPVSIDSNVWYYNCTVYDYRGNTYIMGFNATHTTAGDFKEAVSIFFRYNHPLIQFAGWEDHTGYYQLLSICLLIFFGMLFTGVTLKIGAILLPLAGWVLFGIGWFSPTDNLVTGAILLGIATAVGAGVFMTTSGREKNLAS